MKKSDIGNLPEYYDRYINQVEDIDLSEALQESLLALKKLDIKDLEKLSGKTYAPGKWTLKDILQHMIDTERILSYRALRFARNDGAKIEGFDQEAYAENSNANSRWASELMDELINVRRSTISMFNSFDVGQLMRRGVSWQYEMSVLAMGFTIVGHQVHHMKIIEEKYLPLTGT